MGGDTNALMPPNNTSIETILKAMKDKTDKIMRPTKKLVDSGTQEIFNMEPKKKFELNFNLNYFSNINISNILIDLNA